MKMEMTLSVFNANFQVTLSKYIPSDTDVTVGFTVKFLRNGGAKYFEVTVSEGANTQDTVDSAWNSLKNTIRAWADIEYNKPIDAEFTPHII